MSRYYDHLLHKTYQIRVNSEINIKQNIFEAMEDYTRFENDLTVYPENQESLLDNRFPLAGIHSFPDLQMSDYIMCINNYRENGNLFTVRFVHPDEKYSEVLFLNPNENGQVWLLIISTGVQMVENVKKYSNVNLSNDILKYL